MLGNKKRRHHWNCVSGCFREFSASTESLLLLHQLICKQYNDQKSLNHFTSDLSQDHSSISQDHSSISQDHSSIHFENGKRSKIYTISASTVYECVSECSRSFRTFSLHQLSIHKSSCCQYKIQIQQQKEDEKLALQLQAKLDDEATLDRLIQEEIYNKTQPENIAFNFISKTQQLMINSADVKV